MDWRENFGSLDEDEAAELEELARESRECLDSHQRLALASVLAEMDAVDQEDIQKRSSSEGGRMPQEEIEEALEELDNLDI